MDQHVVMPEESPAPQRFGPGVERQDGRDFPFYDGDQVTIGASGWWLVVGGVAAAFASLYLTLLIPHLATVFAATLLFVLLPLAALRAAAGPRHWTAIFHRVSARDVGVMIGFALLSLALTFVAAAIASTLTTIEQNPIVDVLDGITARTVLLLAVQTAIQLPGEELLTILPFLAVLTWCTRRRGMSRRRAVVIAWLVTALGFALVHLPTYGWNVVQVLLVISVARLVLTWAYVRTKNVWVSTGAHVLHDWVIFGLVVLSQQAGGQA